MYVRLREQRGDAGLCHGMLQSLGGKMASSWRQRLHAWRWGEASATLNPHKDFDRNRAKVAADDDRPVPVARWTGTSGRHVADAPRQSAWVDTQAPTVSAWMAANATVGRAYSFDWCRFRRNSHCYFTDIVDDDASQEVGYAVYIPMDRGTCWRAVWDVQRKCESAQPGPHANTGTFIRGTGPAYTDATVPWEAMGQRDSELTKNYAPPSYSAKTPWLESFPPPMSDGDRVSQDHASLPLAGAPHARVLTSSARVRGLGDLVQLRTSGYLTQAEFQLLRSRIDFGRSVRTSEVPLGSVDAVVHPAARLTSLHASGLLSDVEHQSLLQRI